MNTFGKIKTKIENTAVKLAKKPEFKRFILEFKHLVLENKDLLELYFIYDDLSSNKGLPNDIANEYINESIEYSQILIEGQNESLNDITFWINSWSKDSTNNYSDIDNAIYKTGIKNLENILESKKNIKNIITKEENRKEIKESVNIPISSMVKIANENLKKEVSNLPLSEQKELEEIVSMSYEDLKTEMSKLKENVVNGLKETLNESKEVDLKESINKTINKVMGSEITHYDYYKLKKLSSGL